MAHSTTDPTEASEEEAPAGNNLPEHGLPAPAETVGAETVHCPGRKAPRPPRSTLAGHWRRWAAIYRVHGHGGLTVLALLIGAGAGLGAVAFRYMILGLTYLFSGHRDYSAVGQAGNPLVPGLGIWFVVVAPVIGGLIYGPLVARYAPEARGHGVPEVMLGGQPLRRTDAAAGTNRQVARLGAVHRFRWLRGPRRAHRSDWRGARIGDRATASAVGVTTAVARGVRRRRRNISNLQRADRRGVLFT